MTGNGFCTLGSGSKGNCTFFSYEGTSILIDVGLTKKRLCSLLEQIGSSLDQIDAIFISHEHHDHIAGLKNIIKERSIPIFCNLETAKSIYKSLNMENLPFQIFVTGGSFALKNVNVTTIGVAHDALDPVAFKIQTPDLTFVSMTDVGCMTEALFEKIKEADYMILEANHEVDLVHKSHRSITYKQRVLSSFGHLSNNDAIDTIEKMVQLNLKKVLFAHLSEECNDVEVLKEKSKHLPVEIAMQNEPSTFIETKLVQQY